MSPKTNFRKFWYQLQVTLFKMLIAALNDVFTGFKRPTSSFKSILNTVVLCLWPGILSSILSFPYYHPEIQNIYFWQFVWTNATFSGKLQVLKFYFEFRNTFPQSIQERGLESQSLAKSPFFHYLRCCWKYIRGYNHACVYYCNLTKLGYSISRKEPIHNIEHRGLSSIASGLKIMNVLIPSIDSYLKRKVCMCAFDCLNGNVCTYV